MNDYSTEEEKVIEEKRNFILSIRKRKINFKLFEGRNITRFNSKNISNIFDAENNNIIINIKSKFNEIFLEENNNEEKFLIILDDLIENLHCLFKNKKIKYISEEIIESSVIEKIYDCLMINKYINNNEIVSLVLIIFSLIIFLYNKFPHLTIYKNKFLDNEKFIILYSSLLNSNDDEVIYYTYKFIGLLAHDSKDIFTKLFDNKILEQIINNKNFENNIDIITIKLGCISNFNLSSGYKKDIPLSLKIQNLYIFIFNEYILKNNYTNELLEHFVKIIKNLSNVTDDVYLRNLLNSKIISFLIKYDKENNNKLTENILIIIGNMNFTSNEEIISELHKEVIKYLINIISNEKYKYNNYILGLALWNINSFLEIKNLCYETFFKYDLISIYKNYLLENQIINDNTFNEICLSFKNLIIYIIEDKNFFYIKEHNIISLIIEGFKKINNNNDLIKITENIINVLLLLFTINNKDISNSFITIFENLGGIEYIFDKIRELILEKHKNNLKNGINKEKDKKENEILKLIDIIQKNVFGNE